MPALLRNADTKPNSMRPTLPFRKQRVNAPQDREEVIGAIKVIASQQRVDTQSRKYRSVLAVSGHIVISAGP